MEPKSYLPIEEAQLSRWSDTANRLIVSVAWAPKPLAGAAPQPAGTHQFREATNAPVEEKLSLLANAKRVSKDPVLLSEATNHVLGTVRNGLRIAMHVSSLYTNFSGLQTLIDHNARGALSDAQKTEFRAKYETASAITVFVAAAYVRWSLSNYKAEEVGSTNVQFQGIPELPLLNPVRALDCMVYYYAAYIEKSGSVNTDLEFVKMTLEYFEAIISEVQMREEALKYTEPFERQSYKLAGSEFSIEGFHAELQPREASIEFNRVEISQIVGNRDAKHKARRLAERLICYDVATQRNPIHDLGGLQLVRMGHGEPGTGKSLQIAATATLLHDYCKTLGIPFLFWPMPDTVVSTFQGGSAERMVQWMKPLRDVTKIIYAPIDDAENNLEDRTRQGVSAGVREVIAVFLRNTEGAYAVHHGNAAIELYTNLPDQLDKAVLSRIMDRFYIGGAIEPEDFIDQDYLWWRKYEEMAPGFVDAKKPKYEFLSKQKLVNSLSRVYDSITAPTDERVHRIFDRMKAKHKATDHAFFGEFFAEVKKEFPLFTSRDIRNIQQSVSSRVMDFDLEPAWLADPELFFKKEYDTKKNMIIEMMKKNMRGLNFSEIRLQETIRYIESMVRIVSAGRERQLNEMMTQMEIRREAEQALTRRLQQQNG